VTALESRKRTRVELGSRWRHLNTNDVWIATSIDRRGGPGGLDSIVLLGPSERTVRVWSDYLLDPHGWEALDG
jgi:hypothetical protein